MKKISFFIDPIKYGPVDLLIIQGSPFCNIACTYCYLPDKNLTKKITLSLVRKTFERLQESNLLSNKITVVWHAGEPLTVPLNYYEEIFKLINSLLPNCIVLTHSFQTNGTLINQPWCDFIKRHEIKIGVSIDGPKYIHDRYRLKRNGKGSFEDAMKGVEFLKKNEIDFHIISVITEFALDYPEEIFNFFVDLGVQRLGFNIEEQEGINQSSSMTASIAAKVKYFLSAIFQLQKNLSGKIIIREFDAAFGKIMGNPFLLNNSVLSTIPNSHLLKPYGIISVDADGNFMTFSPELLGQKSDLYGDFILGNVATDSFKEVLHSEKFKNIYAHIKNGVEMCRKTCSYFNVCGGGAPSNKYYENNTFQSTETMFCKYSIQMPLDIVLEDIEKIIL